MNEAVVVERLLDVIRTCENAQRLGDDPYIAENSAILRANLRRIDGAHCKSWLGYHAQVYYRGFDLPAPGDHFSADWGLREAFGNTASQSWIEYSPEAVETAAMGGVANDYLVRLESASKLAATTVDEARGTLLTIVDVLLDREQSSTIERLRTDIERVDPRISTDKIIEVQMPTGSFISHDLTAVNQGVRCPPHTAITARQISLTHPFGSLATLVKATNALLEYMEIHDMVDRATLEKGARVFIGHGRSPLWHELKDFLEDRLGLAWDEFNREPVAGIATSIRLEQMLDHASFAFLILTAEDIHLDTSVHARENVIHEVGLFQGRLGVSRAIMLLEEGCAEFSNVQGIGQIRFPPGKIEASFEHVRRVLEREAIIKKH